MDLRQLQQQLGQAVFPATSTASVTTALQQQIESQQPLSHLERIHIYRDNIIGSHHNALIAIFQVTYQVVGKKLFLQWATTYSQSVKTSLIDLNYYGEYFPALIQQQCQQEKPLKDFLYLADLAQLEYYYHQAYYSQDDPQFDFAAFERLAQKPEQLFFQRSHALSVLETVYPILTLWKNHHTPHHTTKTVEALQQCDFLCIYRYENQVAITQIDRAIYHVLQDCCQHSLAQLAQKPLTAQGLNDLPMLINAAWIVGVRRGEGHCA